MEDAIADDLREADKENQRLRKELEWALETLEKHADSGALLDLVRQKRRSLSQKDKN